MKVAVASQGKELTSASDPRFGRCDYFILFDTETEEWEAIENPGVDASGGAGIKTAQDIANREVKAVLVNNIGPNAVEVLNAAGVKIYSGISGTVEESIEMFQSGQLKETSRETVGSHFGMGGSGVGGGGRGMGGGRGAGGGRGMGRGR